VTPASRHSRDVRDFARSRRRDEPRRNESECSGTARC